MLIDDLRAACDDDWRAFTHHPFVAALADGTLPAAAFRHYLEQDYRFLVGFARAHALEALKADTVEDLRWAAAAAAGIVEVEMRLHVDYCAGWGIDEVALEAIAEDPRTTAYTDFVLATGMEGDALDLAVALAPCTVGYGEIGARLLADPATRLDGNPYAAWIGVYGGDEFQRGVDDAVTRMERMAGRRDVVARRDRLVAIFREAARLEADFWQMGLDAG